MPLPERQTHRLQWGRVSVPGARYFLTLCTQDRIPVLTSSSASDQVLAALHTLHGTDAELLTATLMPDHVHVLFTLGERLTLGQVMGKFKTLARNRGRALWRWQEDGFEHRLRPEESAEDYGFYIFMNPYRANLWPLSQAWPWWVCPEPTRFRFFQHLAPDGTPPSEWLGEAETVAARISTGEP